MLFSTWYDSNYVIESNYEHNMNIKRYNSRYNEQQKKMTLLCYASSGSLNKPAQPCSLIIVTVFSVRQYTLFNIVLFNLKMKAEI